MRITRGHFLLALGILAGAGAVVIIVAPETIPPEIESFVTELDEDAVTQVAAALGVFVVLVALFQTIRTNAEELDRSPIVDTPPETVSERRGPDVSEQTANTYGNAVLEFEEPDHTTRRIAMYGRRAEIVVTLPSSIDAQFEELTTTASRAYAVATGCSEERAREAVADGTWTTDRIAAAFLASEADAEPEFSTWERFVAWLLPRQTYESRLERTLSAIDAHAGSFLSHSQELTVQPTENQQRGQQHHETPEDETLRRNGNHSRQGQPATQPARTASNAQPRRQHSGQAANSQRQAANGKHRSGTAQNQQTTQPSQGRQGDTQHQQRDR